MPQPPYTHPIATPPDAPGPPQDPPEGEARRAGPRPTYRAAIVGAGRGGEAILRMVAEDRLERFQMQIVGVADTDLDAPGMRYARSIGVPHIVTDFQALFEIPDLQVIIELTGSEAVRDELERSRPRHIRLIDHFGASLFWELYTAEEAIINHRTELRQRVETERRWISQIFDSIPDEIVVVDREMVVQDANASFLRNNDYPDIEAVRGKRCYEVEQRVRGECQVAVEDCPFFTAMRNRTTTSLVRKHFDKMGRARFAAIVAAPLLDSGGEVVGVIESTRDISHRILLEEELRAAEGRLQQFLDLAPVAAFVKNTRGQYLEVNPAACALVGKEKHEILGRTDLETLPREAAELFRREDREVLSTRAPLHTERQIPLRGQTVTLSTTRFPLFDAHGEVTGVGVLVRDVTALRDAEAELDRTRAYISNVANHSPLIIVTLDLTGKVLSFNPGAEEAIGYQADELIGQSVAVFFPDEQERRALQRRVREHGAVRDHETHLVRKDGSRVPVSMTISRLRDADGAVVGTVTIAKDISARRALLNQVLQSERMAAVGRLASGVAHEINNPLAVIGEIAGYLGELLEDDPAVDDAETRQEMEVGLPKITQQVQRCRAITLRLLSFARKSAARIEVTDVNRALEEILPFVAKEAQLARVEIHKAYTANLPPVRIEEMQLQEIFINLINNAIQAVSTERKADGCVLLETRREGNKVVVEVQDNGPGIEPDVADKIFDPFVTTKAPGVGTGLGLSICYAIVKRYDGEILVGSDPGLGASFQVVLPIHTPGAEDEPSTDPLDAPEPPEQPQGGWQ